MDMDDLLVSAGAVAVGAVIAAAFALLVGGLKRKSHFQNQFP